MKTFPWFKQLLFETKKIPLTSDYNLSRNSLKSMENWPNVRSVPNKFFSALIKLISLIYRGWFFVIKLKTSSAMVLVKTCNFKLSKFSWCLNDIYWLKVVTTFTFQYWNFYQWDCCKDLVVSVWFSLRKNK